MRQPLERITVSIVPGDRRRGVLVAGRLRLPCALGRSGVVFAKRESDGGTPHARLPVRRLWWRPDKGPRPRTMLPVKAIRPGDLWCDDPIDRNYNRHVRAPYAASHEEMFRGDDVYDLVVELGWNDRPRAKGRGSAIFLHLAREGLSPTEGCIALRRRDMEKLLPLLSPATVLVVG